MHQAASGGRVPWPLLPPPPRFWHRSALSLAPASVLHLRQLGAGKSPAPSGTVAAFLALLRQCGAGTGLVSPVQALVPHVVCRGGGEAPALPLQESHQGHSGDVWGAGLGWSESWGIAVSSRLGTGESGRASVSRTLGGGELSGDTEDRRGAEALGGRLQVAYELWALGWV